MVYDLDDDIQRFTLMRDELQAEIDVLSDQHRAISRALAALQGTPDEVPAGWIPSTATLDDTANTVTVAPARHLQVATGPAPESQRKAAEPKKHGRPRQPINHGTPGGFQAHKKRGEEACEPCKQAKRDYDREARRKMRAEKDEAGALGAAPFDPQAARNAAASSI